MRVHKHRHQKFYALLMIFMLILSLITPQIASAEGTTSLDINTLEEDLELERELEQNLESGESVEEVEESYDVKFPEEDGLPRLIDGLDINYPQFEDTLEEMNENQYDEKDFTSNGKVEKKILQSLEEEDTVAVIIRMKEQQDKVKMFRDAANASNRTERLEIVQERLKDVASKSQAGVLENLSMFENNGQAFKIKPLWIINGVAAELSEDALNKISQRDDVERVLLDEVYEVPEVTVEESSPRLPEWGLEKINATDVWGEYGIDGEGIVVGIMDTGVEGEHEALKENYRGRNGDHASSWIDLSGHSYETPKDGNGHGTHVAGTAVGGGEGEPVGVAPGAEWIAAKIFTDSGSTTESAIHQAFEWFMAPGGDPANAPHVVNNSWGNSNTYNVSFYDDVQAWVAAGIFPLFAAGNDGPGSQTIGSPASFIDSFAIGATDSSDQAAGFSSRGPVFWNGERYVKPDVSAPGREIYSAWPGNGYHTISGTSMATPHVAGVIALIMQANPDYSIDEVKQLMKNTARSESHMGQLPNDSYGSGIVNAYQAVTEAAFAGEVQGQLLDSNGDGIAGQIVIEEENIHVQTAEDGSFQFKIREGTYNVTLQAFGYYSNDETITIEQGEVAEVTWQLSEAARYNLTGLVEKEDGTPVPYAYVNILGTPFEFARTNERGEFEFINIPEGIYDLTVSGQGITSKEQTIEVNRASEVIVTVSDSTAVSDADWVTANNNLTRNAFSNEDISVEHLEESWSFNTAGNIVFSSPVVNEDTIITVTDQGRVQAIDQNTGEEKWQYSTGQLNRSTPTIADGKVFVTAGQNRALYALEIDTGTILWEKELENVPVYETPLYEDGILYVSSTINDNTVVSALDSESGNDIWSTTVPSGSYFGAAVADGVLLIGTYEGATLHALSTNDGSELWTFEAGGEGFASHPVIENGTVYAFSTNFTSRNGTLWAINASTGEEVWNADGIGDTQAASPIVYGDAIIASSAAKPVLKAFDKSTGALLWENKAVNTTVNNGAVSSNGILFMADSSNTLKAINTFNGEIVSEWLLDASSSSTPAINAGQVIVGTQAGVTVYEAPGGLAGTITDADGQPVKGVARIVGTDIKAEADETGNFELLVQPGTYDVKVTKYGLEQVIEEKTFRSGFTHENTYSLETVRDGQVSGTIINERSGEPVEDALLRIQGSSIETRSITDGTFTFDSIAAGIHEVIIEASGYVNQQVTIEVHADESEELTVQMAPIDVAVLDDYDHAITSLLNRNGIPAEEQQWDKILNELENYQVLYLNGAYTSGGKKPDQAEMDELLETAKINDVSVVFTEAWGPSYGSIQQLSDYYNDPRTVQSDFNDSAISIVIDQDHPVFGEHEVGDRISIMNRGKGSWFNGFSGRNLAALGSQRLGDVGTGVAYKAVSQNSAHFLLSTNTAASWNMPTQHWLKAQHDLLINSISYLVADAQYGELTGQIVDQNGDSLDARIEVRQTGVFVESNDDGQFDLFHDEGTFEVEVRKTGYETQTIELHFEAGNVISETIELVPSNEGRISGDITDAITSNPISNVEVKLYDDNGEVVSDATTSDNGYYELSDLSEAVYTIEFIHADYVLESEEVEVVGVPIGLNKALNAAPNVAVIGDRAYGDDTLVHILGDFNIEVTNYSSTTALTEEIEQYDVVFFNNESGLSKADFDLFEQAADDHGVSIIYGDQYFSGGGIRNLVGLRDNPQSQQTLNIRSSSAQYVIDESHPVFGDADAGDAVNILNPDGSRVATFDGYDGFILAAIKHEENEESHGPGVAYKPRTEESLELLMSGHSIGFGHTGEDYTEAGINMFKDAVIWAAYENFNVVQGTVTDNDGNPLDAEVTVTINEKSLTEKTNTEDGYFNIASLDGDAEVTVTSFGYQTETFNVTVDEALEAMTVDLEVKENAGSIEGVVTNSLSINGLEDVHIDVVGYPREATTDLQGGYTISALEPGTYELSITKEDFVQEDIIIEIGAGETKQVDIKLRPSPTVGIVVDSQSSSATSLADYLEDRGFNTVSMFYDDLDMLEEVDVVFANSDYNNSLIPDEKMFKRFVSALDESETSVIWTGQHGGRGSIRYLVDYTGNPSIEYRGSGSGTMTAQILEDHPIFQGVEDSFEFTSQSGYYYGFDGYSGTMLADYNHSGLEEEGYMVGYKGRTINSVEVLLAGMTIGHNFHSESIHFDENRERILTNAILWAIDHEDSYAGELRGSVLNDLDRSIQAQISVTETGETIETDHEGNFFVGLDEGSYTLQIDAFGHDGETFEVQIVNGEISQETFILQSQNAGEIAGEVRSVSTGDLIEGANVEVLDTPLNTETDAGGEYTVTVPAGDYQVRVTASGYQPQTVDVTVETGEITNTTILMDDSEAIALIASSLNHNRLIPFLEANGYEVTAFNRNEHEAVKENMEDFALVIFNDSGQSMAESDFTGLIDAADEAQVSMVFTSQWGNGSISHLENYLGDPNESSHSYVPNSVQYEVLEEHPIFRGFNTGDTIPLLEREGYNQQYAVFEGYSGTTIADVVHEDVGRLGGGLAFDFRSSNHVHVLLGSLSSSSYGHPEDRWTDNARTIYLNSIDWAMTASLGELTGVVEDESGDPIQGARITVDGEGASTQTNDQGRYTLGVGIGEHQVNVTAIGYEPVQETVQVEEIGDSVELNFTLERSEQMTLHGQVTNHSTEEGLEEVTVHVTSKEHKMDWSVVTDAGGKYEVSDLLEGNYTVTFTKDGYHSVTQEIEIESGQDRELNVSISAFNIGVLGDYKGGLSALLNDHELAAEPVDWTVIDHMDRYDVIIVNANKGSEEDVNALLEKSNEHQTSLVFLDTWGVDSGSIHLLAKAVGYPTQDQQGYDEGGVSINADGNEHPILHGFESEIQILAEKSPYATFKGYEGVVIGNVTVDGEEKGSSIGYEFQSDKHVQLLLSAFSVNNMVGPEQGWTEDGKTLFVQAIEWARDAKVELPNPPEWKTEHERFHQEEVIIEGYADPGVTVRILEDEEVLAEVTANNEGVFTAELELALGSHKIDAEAVNLAGTVRSNSQMHVIVVPKPGNPGKR
ncbi:carboxypeptidase regulatory-like domain-containing protein [Virgibacillus sp. C22-A2]|uniref:Carboxypeptidase regulatory-like domain-containing protein n=1 Tax=Virgibacillus tibetensis TaxID=3042313 RepID=A0ABU6KMZ9_9BACI|nr:carboxypeptidase regulatory-like domain-containing protein [Virgibacillus sp. C22-A2]